MLEQAIGYAGQARFVAFYWTPAGDEAMYADGQTSADGEWTGYLAFVDHPAALLHMAGYRDKLGSSDDHATHWLILDRKARAISACEAVEARHFLRQQWPALAETIGADGFPPITPEEWQTVVERLNAMLRDIPTPTLAPDLPDLIGDRGIMARLDAQERLCAEMTAWLDQQLPPDWKQNLLDALAMPVPDSDSKGASR
jgi:hypothetical protein